MSGFTDDDSTARPCHPDHFQKRLLRLGNMEQDAISSDPMKGVWRSTESCSRTIQEVKGWHVSIAPSSFYQHSLAQVKTNRMTAGCHLQRKLAYVIACPTPDIGYLHAWFEPRQFEGLFFVDLE
jgi:hypothetical protein